MKYYAMIATVLFASAASAAGSLGWNAYERKTVETAGKCSLEIVEPVVYAAVLRDDPTATPDAQTAATVGRMEAHLQKWSNEARRFYANMVSGSECIPRDDGMQLYINANITAKFASYSWSSWAHESSSYTGGAHGYDAVYYMVLAPSGDVVAFNTVLAASVDQFIETVRAKVQAQQDQYDETFFDIWTDLSRKSGLSDLNYMANERGITIVFNPYAINAYVVGPTVIEYSWSELRSLLKTDSIFSKYLQ